MLYTLEGSIANEDCSEFDMLGLGTQEQRNALSIFCSYVLFVPLSISAGPRVLNSLTKLVPYLPYFGQILDHSLENDHARSRSLVIRTVPD